VFVNRVAGDRVKRPESRAAYIADFRSGYELGSNIKYPSSASVSNTIGEYSESSGLGNHRVELRVLMVVFIRCSKAALSLFSTRCI
jgi:hypothetical protein